MILKQTRHNHARNALTSQRIPISIFKTVKFARKKYARKTSGQYSIDSTLTYWVRCIRRASLLNISALLHDLGLARVLGRNMTPSVGLTEALKTRRLEAQNSAVLLYAGSPG